MIGNDILDLNRLTVGDVIAHATAALVVSRKSPVYVSGSLPRFPYLTVMDHITIASVVVIASTMLVNLAGSRLDPAANLRLDRICRGAFPAAFALVIAYVLTRSGG